MLLRIHRLWKSYCLSYPYLGQVFFRSHFGLVSIFHSWKFWYLEKECMFGTRRRPKSDKDCRKNPGKGKLDAWGTDAEAPRALKEVAQCTYLLGKTFCSEKVSINRQNPTLRFSRFCSKETIVRLWILLRKHLLLYSTYTNFYIVDTATPWPVQTESHQLKKGTSPQIFFIGCDLLKINIYADLNMLV